MNETHMRTMPLHITTHHLRLSPALSGFLRDKFAKVSRFANDVLAADIVLRRNHDSLDGKRFSASGRLSVAGRDIHATATHADLYTAIVKLVARLARRSRKRKTRFEKSRSLRRLSSRRHFASIFHHDKRDGADPDGIPIETLPSHLES